MARSDSGEQSAGDETTLARQFCLGDESAFAPLVHIWEHRLLTIAYRVVGNVHDAEEVRQNVLLKLVQSPNRLPESAHFAGWLRRCIVNEAITWLRRRGAEAAWNRRNAVEAIACQSSSPLQEALAAERSRRLLHAISQREKDGQSRRHPERATRRGRGDSCSRRSHPPSLFRTREIRRNSRERSAEIGSGARRRATLMVLEWTQGDSPVFAAGHHRAPMRSIGRRGRREGHPGAPCAASSVGRDKSP